jgi:hypothetical protein
MHFSRKLCRLKWPLGRNGGRTTQKAPIKVWEDDKYMADLFWDKNRPMWLRQSLITWFYFFLKLISSFTEKFPVKIRFLSTQILRFQ